MPLKEKVGHLKKKHMFIGTPDCSDDETMWETPASACSPLPAERSLDAIRSAAATGGILSLEEIGRIGGFVSERAGIF